MTDRGISAPSNIMAWAALVALVLIPMPSFAQTAADPGAPPPPPGRSAQAMGGVTKAGAALSVQETVLLSVLALSAVAVGGVLVSKAVKHDDPVSP